MLLGECVCVCVCVCLFVWVCVSLSLLSWFQPDSSLGLLSLPSLLSQPHSMGSSTSAIFV